MPDTSWSRHPSYCGFFYWAVFTQILLGNVFSTIAFVAILGHFFSSRIKGKNLSLKSRRATAACADASKEEEKFLVKFFGDDYVQYRKRVGTGLPFMISQA